MPQQRYNFDQIRSDSDNDRENGAGSDDEEEHEAGEIFADYRPSKLHIGMPHPDPVVETASLAAVEPPDITYELHIHVRHPLDIAVYPAANLPVCSGRHVPELGRSICSTQK